MREFWTVFSHLIRLRWKLSARVLARSSVLQLGVALAFLVFVPAANAAGMACYQKFHTLPPAQGRNLLSVSLLGVQAVWLALLLLAGGAGLTLGRSLPTAPLRTFPVRSLQIVGASTLGALIDLPLLLAMPVFIAATRAFGGGQTAPTLFAATTLGVFAVQTTASAPLLEQIGETLKRQRRWQAAVGIAVSAGAFFLLARLLPALLPSGIAAGAIGAASCGDWGIASLSLAALIGLTALGIRGAALLLDASSVRVGETAPRGARANERTTAQTKADESTGLWAQTRFLLQTEWRSLTRASGRHLPLRWPAVMLVFTFFAWVAPNRGPDALLNASDLLGIGAILYVVFWQLQLLCNRFGTEAGTAALLFGMPMPRQRLLLGRNLALLSLLLLVDSVGLGILFAIAHPERILAVAILAWLLPVLILMTALGNFATVSHPFPIATRGEGFAREPEISAGIAYMFLIGASAALIWLCGEAAVGMLAPLLGLVVAAATYALTLPIAARRLVARETRLIRALDGKG